MFQNRLDGSGLLEKGRYKIYFSTKPFLYNVYEYENLKKYNNRSSKWLELLNSPICISDEKKTNFSGQAIRLVQNDKFQIYDFQRKRVLTIFKEKKQQLKIKGIYLRLKGKLSLTYLGTNSMGILERYIDCNPECFCNEQEKKRQYLQVINDMEHMIRYSYKQQFLNVNSYKKKWICDVRGINDLLSEIEKRIDGEKIPQIYIHGDVHRGNILKDSNGKLYYIDIEYARDDVFFYDCFNYIYVDYVYNNDNVLMNMYLEKDNEIFSGIKKIFQAVGLEFNESDYLQYWLVFLQRRIIEEINLSYVYLLDKNNRESYLQKYVNFYEVIMRRV